jgi:hypothetical protein
VDVALAGDLSPREEERKRRISLLHSSISNEIRLRAGALQMLVASGNSGTASPSSNSRNKTDRDGRPHDNAVQAQLAYYVAVSTLKISALRRELSDLETLDSTINGTSTPGSRLELRNGKDEESIREVDRDCHGHVLGPAAEYRPMRSCDVCCGDEWSGSFVECALCGLCCHRQCHCMVLVGCREVLALRHVSATYFMAASVEECRQWVRVVDAARRTWLSGLLSKRHA